MKSLNVKMVLAAVGIAMLATPALAQKPRHQATHQEQQYPSANIENNGVGTYPNFATKSGSAESVESGAEFNILR